MGEKPDPFVQPSAIGATRTPVPSSLPLGADHPKAAESVDATCGHGAPVACAKCWSEAIGFIASLRKEVEATESVIDEVRRERNKLRDWRDTVTVALGNPGGTAYADVPAEVRRLRAELEAARAALRAYAPRCARGDCEKLAVVRTNRCGGYDLCLDHAADPNYPGTRESLPHAAAIEAALAAEVKS